MNSRNFLSNAALLFLSMVLVLFVCEIFLRALHWPPQVFSGWVYRGSLFETNKLGFRGQPIAYSSEDFVIVLLGDSQVVGAECAYNWMPERRLEHYLNQQELHTKVFTLGAIGYGQDQQLLVLREYYRRGFRADLVILWQTPVNDVWNNLFPTNIPANGWPKPTFRIKDGMLQEPAEYMGQELTSKIKLIALAQHAFVLNHRDESWERTMPPAYSPMLSYEGPVNKEWEERWKINKFSMRMENFDNEKTHWAVALTPASRRTIYGLQLTRMLLLKIEELALRHRSQFVILQRGVREEIEIPTEEVFVLHGKYYRVSPKQYQENSRLVNQGFEVYWIPITEKDWRFSIEESHLNERAVDQMMRDLAGRLLKDFRTIASKN